MTDQPLLDALAARLQRLEDERSIQDTLYRYSHTIDYGPESDWLDCFTEDGVFDVRLRKYSEASFRCEGRDELAKWIAVHDRAPESYHKYVVAVPRIFVSGDTATSDCYFVKTQAHDDEPTTIVVTGRYRDRLVRGDDGRWRFAERIAETEDM